MSCLCAAFRTYPGSGHVDYRGTAPIFVTTKLRHLKRLCWWASDDPHSGVPRDTEAAMFYRRLKIYEFKHRFPKPASKIPFCAKCFAQFVFHYAGYAPASSFVPVWLFEHSPVDLDISNAAQGVWVQLPVFAWRLRPF